MLTGSVKKKLSIMGKHDPSTIAEAETAPKSNSVIFQVSEDKDTSGCLGSVLMRTEEDDLSYWTQFGAVCLAALTSWSRAVTPG